MANEFQNLIDAFSHITGTAVRKYVLFGSRSLRVDGISDGAEGVQWNAWVEWDGDKQMAYVGVNLEGKVYDGWPIARFIERELQNARLLEKCAQVSALDRVEVVWYRDAWQVASRPAIKEKLIGGSPRLLHTLSAVEWKEILREAYACLDAAKGHRARSRAEPHNLFGRIAAVSSQPPFSVAPGILAARSSHGEGWRAALDQAFASLRPLHVVVAQQARA